MEEKPDVISDILFMYFEDTNVLHYVYILICKLSCLFAPNPFCLFPHSCITSTSLELACIYAFFSSFSPFIGPTTRSHLPAKTKKNK